MDFSKAKVFKFTFQESAISGFISVEINKSKFGLWDLTIKESKRPFGISKNDFIERKIKDAEVQKFFNKLKLIDFDEWNAWLSKQNAGVIPGSSWGLVISNGGTLGILSKNKIEVAGNGAFPKYFDWFCTLLVDLGAKSLTNAQFERNPYWEPHFI